MPGTTAKHAFFKETILYIILHPNRLIHEHDPAHQEGAVVWAVLAFDPQNYRWGEASWQPFCSHLFTILALSEAKLQKKSQRKVATNDLQPSEAKPERAPQALKMASILTCCWILVP